MTIREPFAPHYGTGQALTATSSSASTTIGKGDKTVKILNTGTGLAFFRIGVGTQVATSADCPIVAGTLTYVSKAQDDDTIGYISSAGSTLQIITGEGGV